MLPHIETHTETTEEIQKKNSILKSFIGPLTSINQNLKNIITFVKVEKNRQELAKEEADSESRGQSTGQSGVVQFIQKTKNLFGELARRFMVFLAPAIMSIYEAIKKVAPAVEEFAQKATAYIVEAGQKMATIVGGFVSSVVSRVGTAINSAFWSVLDIGEEYFPGITKIVVGVIDSINSFITKLVETGKNIVADVVGAFTRRDDTPPRPAATPAATPPAAASTSRGAGPVVTQPTAPVAVSAPPPIPTRGEIGSRQLSSRERPDESVLGAIRAAAEKVGVDLGIMLAMARQESGFRASVRAGTSSATGLYQFIDSTWNSMVSRYGRQYPELARGRADPLANSIAGALFIKENMLALQRAGLPTHSGAVYALHFMGTSGGIKLLKSNPTTIAATLFPDPARANRNIFYNRDGTPRTVAETINKIYSTIMPYESVYRQTYTPPAAAAAVSSGTTAAGTGAVSPPRPQTNSRGSRQTYGRQPTQTNNRPAAGTGVDQNAVRGGYLRRLFGG